MSISSISDTIAATLRENGQSSYVGYAAPVVAQLIEREREITEQIITAASDFGVDPNEARQLFEGLGLAVPAGTQPEENNDDGDGGDRLARLEQQVAALTRFARSNGYRD